MLARSGEPFDSPDWQFEIKWDGTRAVAYVEGATLRLMNRRQLDIAHRFPELRCLARLPSGTVLDGEIVVLRDGKPSFEALQSREHASVSLKIDLLAGATPSTYVLFDQLYDRYGSLMEHPLTERRAALRRTVDQCRSPQVVLADAVAGAGVRCFDAAVRAGLEGIVAKRMDGRYTPGRRSPTWVKIKRQETVQCAIIGYEPQGAGDFKSLALAGDVNGALAYVGKVGTGFDAGLRQRILDLLGAWTTRAKPVVACRGRCVWLEPGLFCEVRCMERTTGGALRAPVFVRLLAQRAQARPSML
jgi:DNA ligase D-like protein (predicted ligase)